MKEKHSFGNQVRCACCGNLVSSVWSELWLLAQGGQGLCDDCVDKPECGPTGPEAGGPGPQEMSPSDEPRSTVPVEELGRPHPVPDEIQPREVQVNGG